MISRSFWIVALLFVIALPTLLILSLPIFSPQEHETLKVTGGKRLPDFTLLDQYNRSFSLSTVKGRPVILFFGYTNCPDICPLAMRKIADSLKSLGGKADEFAVIFITVDPARDTPPILAKWVSQYSPGAIALTGELEELGRVWRLYGVARVEDYESAEKAGEFYYVSHSAVIYVADRDHVLQYILTPEMSVEDFRECLERIS